MTYVLCALISPILCMISNLFVPFAFVVAIFSNCNVAITRPSRFLGHMHGGFAPLVVVRSSQGREHQRYASGTVARAIDLYGGFVNERERKEPLNKIILQLQSILYGFVYNLREQHHGSRGEEVMFTAAVLTSFVVGGVPPILSYLIKFTGDALCYGGCCDILASIWQLKEMNSPYLNPCRGNRLITHGIYEHVKHPMYGGLIMASAGFAVSTKSVEKLVITAALACVLAAAAIIEEVLLEAAHPRAYARYASDKKFFVPYIV